jgi:hypothetical protein
MELNARLSPSQTKFALWVKSKAPYLLPLFDFNERIYIDRAVERFLGGASHGQTIMARFVLGVWCNEDRFDFDFTAAASVLDSEQRKIITDWMAEPFWP